MEVNRRIIKWYYSKVDAVIDNTLTSDKIVCSVFEADALSVGVGMAMCSPNDTYDKEFGRKLSLTRALAGSTLNKVQRMIIWEAYRTMTKTPRW